MNGRPLDQSGKYTYPIQVKSAKTWKGPEKGGRSSEIRRLTWVYFYVHVQIIFMIHGKTLRFTCEDTHTLARECMFIYSDKRRLSPDPPRVAPCNDVQMVAARCPLIRHRDCTGWKYTSFHLTLPLFSVCFHYYLIHDNALSNYAFKICQFQKIWWGSSSSFILFKFCMVI